MSHHQPRQGKPRIRELNLNLHDHRYVARYLVLWVSRLLRRKEPLERQVLGFVAWLLRDEVEPVFRALMPRKRGKRGKRGQRSAHRAEMEDEEDIGFEVYAYHDRIPGISPNHGRYRKLMRLARLDEDRLRGELLKALERQRQSLRGRIRSLLRSNQHALTELFGFSRVERDLFLLTYLVGACPALEHLFEQHLGCGGPTTRRGLATMLGASQEAVTAALGGRFRRMSLLAEPGDSLSLDPDLWPLLEESPGALMERNLFRPLPADAPPLSAYDLPPRVLRLMQGLLRDPPADGSVHVLFHGPPGSGKSTLVRALLSEAGVRAYEVVSPNDNRQGARRVSLLACVQMTNHGDGAVVVMDDADSLLRTERGWSMSGEVQDHAWINQFMDEPGARVVWVANQVESISPAVMRRFAFSLYLPEPGQRQRQRQWQEVATRQGVGPIIGAEEAAQLAADYPVAVGVMDRAVVTAKNAGGEASGALVAQVRLALDSYLELSGRDARAGSRERVVEEFTLEGLNISCDVQALVQDAQAFDSFLRKGEEGGPRALSLLLHGPPGTGKSELARYIAWRLKRELMILHASDLLDSLVGATEQNIAAAFREAEASGALLLFDEADSLLFSREAAVRSWEVSFTNEYLARMERFRGIMACTTNRLSGLDHASLRRFSHKVAFDYLTPRGNELLYGQYLAPLCPAPLDAVASRDLRGVRLLTPGDFRVVRDRHAFRAPGSLSHKQLITALEQEAHLKQTHNHRQAGFAS